MKNLALPILLFLICFGIPTPTNAQMIRLKLSLKIENGTLLQRKIYKTHAYNPLHNIILYNLLKNL